MQQKKPVSSIVAGLLIAAFLIVISLIVSVAGAGTQARPGSGWFTYLIIAVGLMFFISLYAKAKNNQVTFGELFSYGFKATAMLTLVFIAFTVILALANPEWKVKAIEAARADMEHQKAFTDSEIDRNMALMNKYFWVLIIGLMILGFAVVGAIGSLVGAAITRKYGVNPSRDQLDQLDR